VLSGVAAAGVIVVVVDPVAIAEQALDKREGDQTRTDAGVCKSRLFAAIRVTVMTTVLMVSSVSEMGLVTETVWTEVTKEAGGVAMVTTVDIEGAYERWAEQKAAPLALR
jgi:hypothetical protein